MHSSSSHRVGPGEHLRSSSEKISQSLQTISSNFPSCHIISTIRASSAAGWRGGRAGMAPSPTLDGFVLPFSLQINDLPANEELFCNFIFVATILISLPPGLLTNNFKQTIWLSRKRKKKIQRELRFYPWKEVLTRSERSSGSPCALGP